jgi:hypothetical protein
MAHKPYNLSILGYFKIKFFVALFVRCKFKRYQEYLNQSQS